MLSKQNRISLRTERIRLEKAGVTRHSPLFIVVSAPSSLAADAPPRFALLVSRKLAPLSVTRHRLKRTITEVIRLNLARFPKGRDFLLIPKKNLFSANREQILEDLYKLCS